MKLWRQWPKLSLLFYISFCFSSVFGCVVDVDVDTYSTHNQSASQRECNVMNATMWCVRVCMHFRTRVQEHTHPKIKLLVNNFQLSIQHTWKGVYRMIFLIYFLVFGTNALLLLLALCRRLNELAFDDLRFKNVFRSQNLVVAWIAYFFSETKNDSTQLFTTHKSTKRKFGKTQWVSLWITFYFIFVFFTMAISLEFRFYSDLLHYIEQDTRHN